MLIVDNPWEEKKKKREDLQQCSIVEPFKAENELYQESRRLEVNDCFIREMREETCKLQHKREMHEETVNCIRHAGDVLLLASEISLVKGDSGRVRPIGW
jgi:hypothetical protein